MNKSNDTPIQEDPDEVMKMKVRYSEAYLRMLMEESAWEENDKQNTDPQDEDGSPFQRTE